MRARTVNLRNAAQRASDEIFSTSGRDQFFAWFNRGTNLMELQDYIGAAAAYDEAFNIYSGLDPETRPWRLLWYQTGPYWAYYLCRPLLGCAQPDHSDALQHERAGAGRELLLARPWRRKLSGMLPAQSKITRRA